MHRLFWLDLEMTGLEPGTHRILEAAVVVTDLELKPLHSWSTAVFQPPEVLGLMDDWCLRTHGESGLLSRVPQGVSETELDDALCKLARAHFPGEKIVLCGNSIGQDRRFVEAWLPRFAATLHYRLLDVSSFKIVFENRYKKKYAKKNKHTAVEDVLESIEELRYYLSFLDAEKLA
ncbi:MAG: oligoribonuclease [Silvanigrellales bacterium]|jgi:oligoribonuclease|nr:oligoribonuclease [Silvanigrellales bacterium]